MVTSPDRNALFSLRPFDDDKGRAKVVIFDEANSHIRSVLSDGTSALGISIHGTGRSSTTLAVLGRGPDADIYVKGSSISKVQCSFEIDLNTGVVMLHDRSQSLSTQVGGDNATPFEYGRNRKVVVNEGLNTIIGMGGEHRDLIKFELVWHHDLVGSKDLHRLAAMKRGKMDNPRLALTVDEAPTVMPSHYTTRLHTPAPSTQGIRYKTLTVLGAGTFGEVHKAVDADSGKLMAVKIIRRPHAPFQQEKWQNAIQNSLKREIEILSQSTHPNIVDYLGSQNWFDGDVEIFMGLKEGTLHSMMHSGADGGKVTDVVLPDMLKALDFLAFKNIIHRDVKPENILYIMKENGKPQFQLGDFGLSRPAFNAKTFSGTLNYMAPEVFQGEPQTCKADVWSLFVTILWVLNLQGYRMTHFRNFPQISAAVSSILSKGGPISDLREMAIENPAQRGSAAQMLVKLFNGDGLTTPRRQVAPLSVCSPATPLTAADRVSPVMIAIEVYNSTVQQKSPRADMKTPVLGVDDSGRDPSCQIPLNNILSDMEWTRSISRTFSAKLDIPGTVSRIG